MSNPYVFVVGCTRSGTTLLQRIANAHPRLAIIHETHWVPQFFELRRGVTSDGMVTPELIPLLLDHPRFARRFRLSREQLAALIEQGRSVSYSAFVAGLFDLYGQAKGKSLVGDKTPSYVLRINTLNALWPGARFVHLIRDGRDVCLSLMGWWRAGRNLGSLCTWHVDPISTSALYWELRVRRGQQAGRRLGPGLYYEIRYESLVSHPAEECEALCAFLGVPYDEALLRFHEGKTKPAAGRESKRAWLPITPGLRDWRTQMSPEDIERFEAAAGQLLDELGYPRAIPYPRPESLENAARIRELLAQDPKWVEYSESY
jgi:sulfotransferase family protein